jgi:hypothetical protein
VKAMVIDKEKIIKDEKKDVKKDVLSVFSEIISDAKREPIRYVENWKAPGGGE